MTPPQGSHQGYNGQCRRAAGSYTTDLILPHLDLIDPRGLRPDGPAPTAHDFFATYLDSIGYFLYNKF